MKPFRLFLASIFGLCCLATIARAQTKTTDYVAPDKSFAIRVPAAWKVEREALGDGVFLTSFEAAKGGARIEVAVVPSPRELEASMLPDMGQLLIGLGLQAIDDEGTVVAQKTEPAKFGGRDAIRCDILFKLDADKTLREGYGVALIGKKHAYLASVAAPQKDAAALKNAETFLLTLALESGAPLGTVSTKESVTKPAIPPKGWAGGKAALASLATKFKSNLKRDPKDKVLVAGNPPLTYGGVVAYANMMSGIYDIELTESEFDVLQRTFIEIYKNSDEKGRADIAGWDKASEKILAAIAAGTVPKEKAQTVFTETFQQDAAGGNQWAKVILAAIERRTNTLATTSAKRPKFAQKAEVFDTQMSEADLDAAIEMLYFMWVNGGRDPSHVDEESIIGVRTAIVTQFMTFPAELQYVLANAQEVYAGLRNEWAKANFTKRLQMAQKFNTDLDMLGLPVPAPERRGGGGGNRISASGAWSDFNGKDRSTLMAETVVGLAGSSYKSAW